MTKRRRRHSPEQMVRKLRDADAMLNAGKEEAAVLQALEMIQYPPSPSGAVVETGSAIGAAGGRTPLSDRARAIGSTSPSL